MTGQYRALSKHAGLATSRSIMYLARDHTLVAADSPGSRFEHLAAHACAALYHHFKRKDVLLKRMLAPSLVDEKME
ncbi:hypothetical protein [Granulosicoccus sp. 3-233]|uniref:hypothetical protein n=1 Tax=Granulosicoccus sp. 3-233 TaxID=3417969 RepID=UPI003D3543E4